MSVVPLGPRSTITVGSNNYSRNSVTDSYNDRSARQDYRSDEQIYEGDTFSGRFSKSIIGGRQSTNTYNDNSSPAPSAKPRPVSSASTSRIRQTASTATTTTQTDYEDQLAALSARNEAARQQLAALKKAKEEREALKKKQEETMLIEQQVAQLQAELGVEGEAEEGNSKGKKKDKSQGRLSGIFSLPKKVVKKLKRTKSQ
ncbi:hypothetical protein CVT26_010233 [Gymnopilus dilepis]|uniref:Uncharacterized protein n=1 Tax=Gymnopilus dilepis TaxID=231916 RepID=A0A409Y179_9AGAR|nr:hypothetical protein CVT26_010233 [Gymnopilus dilepis]